VGTGHIDPVDHVEHILRLGTVGHRDVGFASLHQHIRGEGGGFHIGPMVHSAVHSQQGGGVVQGLHLLNLVGVSGNTLHSGDGEDFRGGMVGTVGMLAPDIDGVVTVHGQGEVVAGGDGDDVGQRFIGRGGIAGTGSLDLHDLAEVIGVVAGSQIAELAAAVDAHGPHRTVALEEQAVIAAGEHVDDVVHLQALGVLNGGVTHLVEAHLSAGG